MTEKNLKLRFLCLVTRHGHRTPVAFLPNDPNIGFYPEGEAQLTKTGKTEMYNLGRFLRKRYDHFLEDKLFAKDVYVRSTDTDRCLMSAQCLLAGLYPPVNDKEKLSPDVNWQPVSVHAEPYRNDPLAFRFVDEYHLPLTGSYADPVSNELYQNFLKYQDLWNIIDRIGLSNSKSSFMLSVLSLDTILTEMHNNLEIPNELQGREKDLVELFFAFTYLYCHVHSRARTVSAAMLEDIVNRMEALLQGSNASSASAPKTLIFTLHDYNLITLAVVLCKQNIKCPTASSLILELLEDVDSISGDLYVKMRFLAKLNEDPVEMKFQIGADSFSQASIVSFTEFTQFVRAFVKETRDTAQ